MQRRTQRKLGLLPPSPRGVTDVTTLLESAEVSASELRQELKQIFLADTTEISGVWRVPCRFCHGINHQYQYTDAEWRFVEQAATWGELGFPFAAVTNEFNHIVLNHAHAAFQIAREAVKLKETGSQINMQADRKGGGGYSRNAPVNPDCPQCSGLGDTMAYVCDTRRLSDGGKRLYKGVKFKRDGDIEIMTIDRQHIRDMLARDLRVAVERKEINFNFPRTAAEFDEMLSKLPTREIETMIAALVIEGEGYVVKSDAATDVTPADEPQARQGRFQRGN